MKTKISSILSIVFIFFLLVIFTSCPQPTEKTFNNYYLAVASDIPFSSGNKTIPLIQVQPSFLLNFSENINESTVSNSNILLTKKNIDETSENVPITLTTTGSTVRVATANGANFEHGTEYTVKVTTGIKSTQNYSLPSTFTGIFCTQHSVMNLTNKATIVISDIHMGDERALNGTATNGYSYAWFKNNKPYLINFLKWVKSQNDWIKEVVIAGDMFDEWVSPMSVDTYPLNATTKLPISEKEFVAKIAEANSDVISAFKEVKTSGINLVYVPGNHDMLVTQDDLNQTSVFGNNIIEYINTRDKDKLLQDASGLGVYWPNIFNTGTNDGYIAIEHCHRYDLWNAPDTISNRGADKVDSVTENTKLPVGFFVTKMASTHDWEQAKKTTIWLDYFLENQSASTQALSELQNAQTQGHSKLYSIAWNRMWYAITGNGPIYVEKSTNIKTGLDGYTTAYHYDEVALWATKPDTRKIFKKMDLEETWESIQTNNHVDPKVSYFDGVICAYMTSGLDKCSDTQYFGKTDNTARVVVFGHTHAAKTSIFSHDNKTSIYANSGTWVDNSTTGTRNFVILLPNENNGKKTITVGTYQFNEATDIRLLDNRYTIEVN